MRQRIGIIGAGCAGLGAAYYLDKKDHDIEILEGTDRIGGIAGSHEWHGIHLDLAPHRLYTRDKDIERELLDLVPMNTLKRRSEIFLQGKWIQDPVNPMEIITKFFPRKSFHLIWSYLFRDKKLPEDSFESFVLARYGTGLNNLFFKPYSEKLFGISGTDISAGWARRKVRVSSFMDMVRRNTRLYFRQFYYPKQGGYGTICDHLYKEVSDSVRFKTRVVGMQALDMGKEGYVLTTEQDGQRVTTKYDRVVSSLPINELARMLGLNINLSFRPAKIVYLLVNKSQVSPNHWFYFADSAHVINRVAEFKNFTQNGSFGADHTVLCCEVTALEQFSIERVIKDLADVDLIKPDDVLDSKVTSLDYAYPLYCRGYEEELEKANTFFSNYTNLHRLGRHALFAHQDVDEIFVDAKQLVHAMTTQAVYDMPMPERNFGVCVKDRAISTET
jgi:protoporphyrinogen oxidase